MGNESAIIIPIPEAEPLVGPLRLQYDRSARCGVPAHITVLYPFCSIQAAVSQMEVLRELSQSIDKFTFSLIEVRQFLATAYLHPDKSETFVRITKTFAQRWPDCKPYGGTHNDIVPHLTVADRVDSHTLSVVEVVLRRQLPVDCVAAETWLLTSDDAGVWPRRRVFPFRALERVD
jgi:2'-5' RNA ligase